MAALPDFVGFSIFFWPHFEGLVPLLSMHAGTPVHSLLPGLLPLLQSTLVLVQNPPASQAGTPGRLKPPQFRTHLPQPMGQFLRNIAEAGIHLHLLPDAFDSIPFKFHAHAALLY